LVDLMAYRQYVGNVFTEICRQKNWESSMMNVRMYKYVNR
jgi:hypothetical protein